MKRIRKQAACISAALLLAFGSVSSSYASASAIIGGGVTVSAGYAVAWLLGAMGLTAASATVYQNIDSIIEWGDEQYTEFKEFAEQNIEDFETDRETMLANIDAWVSGVQKGVVDTASYVWDVFASFCASLHASASAPALTREEYLSKIKGGPVYIGRPSFESDYKDMSSVLNQKSDYVSHTNTSYGTTYAYVYYGNTYVDFYTDGSYDLCSIKSDRRYQWAGK